MSRHALTPLLVLAFLLPSALSLPLQEAPSIASAWELPPGRYYVEQGIEAQIRAIAGAARPTVAIPDSAVLDIVLLPGVKVRPLAASSIGDTVDRTNEYRIPVRIIPRKSGRIAIPALKLESDGRSGVLPSRRIAVLAPPSGGRTGTFLGGIGRIVATAEARPDAVRVGDALEYRIRLDGPGSIGSLTPPTLSGLDRLGLGLRVERLPSESSIEPPSRTLRFRLRPSRAGSRSLPAFLVSWLDPDSGSYMTSATRAVPIRAVDVPEFQPGDLGLPTTVAAGPDHTIWAVALGVAGLVIAAGSTLWARRRASAARRTHPRKIAERLIRRLEAIGDKETLPREATGAIAEFLQDAAGRPPGVLTPAEARAWAISMGSPQQLAARAEALIAACDRTLYGEDRRIAREGDVRAETIVVLRGLAKVAKAGKPREAPGTA